MIDWERVEELRSEIGGDGFAEVAEMFLQEAEQAVRALVGGTDPGELAHQLHSLKGSALNLGLTDLAMICQDGQRKAAVGKMVDVARVAAVYNASRAVLLRKIATGNAA